VLLVAEKPTCISLGRLCYWTTGGKPHGSSLIRGSYDTLANRPNGSGDRGWGGSQHNVAYRDVPFRPNSGLGLLVPGRRYQRLRLPVDKNYHPRAVNMSAPYQLL